MIDLFQRIVLPVASPEDARATCRALGPYLGETGEIVVVHVIEKAGGAPDKASVEQREAYAADVFEALLECLEGHGPIETDILYGTDVAETIFAAANDRDASAIVITPRGGSRWVQLLTGDIALELVTETDRPVVVLPDAEPDADPSDGTERSDDEAEQSDDTEGGERV